MLANLFDGNPFGDESLHQGHQVVQLSNTHVGLFRFAFRHIDKWKRAEGHEFFVIRARGKNDADIGRTRIVEVKLFENFAAIHQNDAATQFFDFGEQMAGQKDGDAFFGQLLEPRAKQDDAFGVQTIRGFVE